MRQETVGSWFFIICEDQHEELFPYETDFTSNDKEEEEEEEAAGSTQVFTIVVVNWVHTQSLT